MDIRRKRFEPGLPFLLAILTFFRAYFRSSATSPVSAPPSTAPLPIPPSPTPTLDTSQSNCAPRTVHANHPRRRSSRLADKGGRVNQVVSPSTDINASEKSILNADVPVPKHIGELQAMCPEYKILWIAAMNVEFEDIISRGVVVPVERDAIGNHKIVPGTWVFSKKANGTLKARFVLRGDLEKDNKYSLSETYAPTPSTQGLRIVLSIAQGRNFGVISLDYSRAFLNAFRPKTLPKIFMQVPKLVNCDHEYLEVPGNLYGGTTAPRVWLIKHAQIQVERGLTQSTVDKGIWYKKDLAIYAYVDDVIVVGTQAAIKEYVESIQKEYKVSVDYDLAEKFVGMHIKIEKEKISLSQEKFIEEMATETNSDGAKRVSIPFPTHKKLRKIEAGTCHKDYRRYIGQLLWSSKTRPDIAFAIGNLSRHNLANNAEHMKAVKQAIRYLYHTKNWKLHLRPITAGDISIYVDASEVAFEEGKGCTGILITIDQSPIAWKSQKQKLGQAWLGKAASDRSGPWSRYRDCACLFETYRRIVPKRRWWQEQTTPSLDLGQPEK